MKGFFSKFKKFDDEKNAIFLDKLNKVFDKAIFYLALVTVVLVIFLYFILKL